MKTISENMVHEVATAMLGLAPPAIEAMVEEMAAAQPELLGYVIALGETNYHACERELLLYLCVTVWRVMSGAATGIRRVGEQRIARVQEVNAQMVQFLDGEIGPDFARSVRLIVASYNQKDILKYLLETLSEEAAPGGSIRASSAGPMLLDLKTVVDCLDQEAQA